MLQVSGQNDLLLYLCNRGGLRLLSSFTWCSSMNNQVWWEQFPISSHLSGFILKVTVSVARGNSIVTKHLSSICSKGQFSETQIHLKWINTSLSLSTEISPYFALSINLVTVLHFVTGFSNVSSLRKELRQVNLWCISVYQQKHWATTGRNFRYRKECIKVPS